FVKLSAMKYWDGHKEVEKTGSMNPVPGVAGKQEFQHAEGAHPVSCVDCHDPKTVALRVTRPGFINGIKALKAKEGIPAYDPNRDATRQEMRSYVCAQCHVEYYCGPKVTLLFPWANGLKVEEIESFYDNYKFPDGHRFYDWTHAETGAELLKAQHPEFETWSQGVHARSGVACADCHMPYERQGALKVSDHWIRSPMLQINRSCQQCHNYPEAEIKARVNGIQQRNHALLQRAGVALTDMLDAIKSFRQPVDQENLEGAKAKAAEVLAKDAAYAALTPELQEKRAKEETKKGLDAKWQEYIAAHPELHEVLELHRKAQWRLDFVAAENSMGFHAPQETARILGESIDYARQGQVAANKLGRTAK
ncbi:MAG: ammonia-forming cytochrome c nitrite reductase subunit c552, partial [Phycisphaerae bacterium]